MHHLTRTTLSGCAVILALGAAIGLSGLNRPTPEPLLPPASAPEAARGSGVDIAMTQRRDEWSPVCATTGEPLIDFSPVDHGQGVHRMTLTADNCSDQPVTLTEPAMWFGGREGLTDPLRLDAGRTELTPLTLEPQASATAVLTWESAPGEVGTVLSIRLPDVGEGELQDDLALGPTSRVWLSGWLR
ncbi:DUF4232 domain-containing protein [Propioniciclava soli]|uniref:DUF4232 domain-containing protein n=1 Tax=Propioniciclava soli TaxID=2775081 RepID=UPI001E404817